MTTWFRDAKFGIWSHWGPQSVPKRGDWYARRLYLPSVHPETGEKNTFSRRAFHEECFGHPSRFGHKDVIHQWKAEHWDPDGLLELYVRSGARYFVALANHIDNFDLWDSVHQPWNSVNVGPKRDIVAGWAEAAGRRGLPFGISLHANWAWKLLDAAFGSDADGPYAGVSFDGMLTAADGVGTWWEGLDPRELYGRPRRGDEPPDIEFARQFYDRALDCFERFRPRVVYFDDSRPPFGEGSVCPTDPPSSIGDDVVTRMHQLSRQWYGADNPAVVTVKQVDTADGDRLTLDVERALLTQGRDEPWQMDTCLGHWFYDEEVTYKTAEQVVHMLVDVVSKNGNLLLSVPQLPDGTIDDEEVAILNEIGDWLAVNGEGIYGTRPWRVFGEGPTVGEGDRFKERELPYTDADIRFTATQRAIYAFVLGPVGGDVRIRSFRASAVGPTPARVDLLGHFAPAEYAVDGDALWVRLPDRLPTRYVPALRITPAS